MHYEVRGDGRPILMLHGFEMDHHLLSGPMEPLFRSRPGWRRIYVDLPGMGRSAAELVADADAMLDALARVVAAAAKDGPVAVVGESYGGYLARGLAERFPERIAGLFLLCPVVHPWKKDRDLPPFEVRRRDEAFMTALEAPEKADFEAFAVIQTEATWKRFSAEVLPGLRARDRAFCAEYERNRYAFSFDPDARASSFAGPVTVVAGRQDAVVGYRDPAKLAARYPRATYAAVDDAGHNLQYEQPALFEALVVDWLERLTRRGA